ncbi:MAG: HI0074 family nucleotidyltransferase substrate-binding subunit [Bdellovibrionota bacterium]
MSNKIAFDEFEKAIKSFDLALQAPKTDLNRDATIQRFEFCVELSWKLSRKTLGLLSNAPKTIVRELAQEGMIDSAEKWIDYLDLRNLTSHTYKEELAELVYSKCRPFLDDVKKLYKNLRAY